MQTTYQQRYRAYQIRAIFQKGAIYTSLVRLQLGQVTVFWYGFLVIIKINTDWMGLPSKRQVFKNITVNPTQLKKSVSSDFIILGQNIHSNFEIDESDRKRSLKYLDYTLSQKNDTRVAQNLNAHQPILKIFGGEIAETKCYQKWLLSHLS